jgi:biotin carboxyl carrier protein
MQLLMEKEARAKRILMRRINQEKEDLVYRLRANGAQMCIVRCWREFKKRKEDKRKEEERQRRKQKAESERRKAEQAAMERALEEKKQRAKRQADSVARAPSRTASGESDGGMYASVMSLGPGAVASRTSSVSRAGSAENSLDAPVNEGDAVEEDQDLVEQMGGRLAMI